MSNGGGGGGGGGSAGMGIDRNLSIVASRNPTVAHTYMCQCPGNCVSDSTCNDVCTYCFKRPGLYKGSQS